MERALSERLYLVERRDASSSSPSGLVRLRHDFVVLGSTGNVYTASVSQLPSCSCVDFRERSTICKHLLFIYVKEVAAAEQASEAAGSRDEGYLNLAALVPGTAAARDTSTYSPWLEVHQRRRERAEMLGSPP
ncbi:hypothetical protein EMIHUDRAFT_450192 [Emiliania huxleyi CCMP1516]|uniref:SWIM-type domain-containing protein n=2 Tax=Emiliania huxleyi TaxID=2903 RepID=A0A0D3JUK1_EMIH1|nr:hypothetical protein EMIHUDRAFT_450192 [Emiliania huxleyi CCMP1516]EOD27186.1 hypothetical protein EMIHUDRAFT_450192 [Emiliania huxleyi CCMP1516]|eukprot:XP_005779615.1 hypothetical protein EMIHUDRAFT_450192 [Emiliania huxleyi CCMP1516]